MRLVKIFLLTLAALFFADQVLSQNPEDFNQETSDSTHYTFDSVDTQLDVVDVFRKWTHHEAKIQLLNSKSKRVDFTLVPALGYTLQTGFAILLAANTVFYTNQKDRSKASTVLTSIAYTQYNQVILPVSVNLWSKDRKLNMISDFRYMSYPSQTFGLGDQTKFSDGYNIDFSYVKIHQTFLRKIKRGFFAGAGYYYDYLWKVHEVNPPAGTVTSFQQYGLLENETASGICFQGIVDQRINPVNPFGGYYVSGRYRLNDRWMGNSANWRTTIVEGRKYIRFPKESQNIIALWNYNWITISGHPPFLLLPSTGWDDFFNTGRGYIQGRYRARNMSYVEAEYRFRLVKSGLFGGVVFSNLQTFSADKSNLYHNVIPGYGAGLRIKLNRNSNTNFCIDYAFGAEGSRGFFINLGEVF